MKNPIDLVAQAAAFADRYNMLPPGSTILVALSGGGDSMALLSVLEKLAQERDLHLHAAHFNHQLRGEESQRDETFVTEWCEKRNIPLIIGQGDVAQEAKEQGKGVEETARAMRYGFLTQAAQDLGAASWSMMSAPTSAWWSPATSPPTTLHSLKGSSAACMPLTMT